MLKFYLQALFQSAQHIYEKREGSGHGSVPLTNDPDPDPGGPKTCGCCGSGSGSKTLVPAGGYKDMSSIFADQLRPSYTSPNAGGRGVCGVSANEYSCAHITWHGAEINFGDLPPYLTYGFQSSDIVQYTSVFVRCLKSLLQCSVSVTFWDGDGSLDPCTGLQFRIRIRILLIGSFQANIFAYY